MYTLRYFLVFMFIISLAIITFVGCATQMSPIPSLPLRDMSYQTTPADSIKMPDLDDIFNMDMAQSYRRNVDPVPLDVGAWHPISATDLAGIEVQDMVLVGPQHFEKLSPYLSEKIKLVDRVVLLLKDGRFLYTPILGNSPPDGIQSKYLDTNLLLFLSEDGEFSSDGNFRTKPLSPVDVAENGFKATVSLKGSGFVKHVIVQPKFTGIKEVELSASHGASGRSGDDGRMGAWGSSGYDGKWPGMNSSPRDGTDGRDGGHGGDGTAAGDGRRGGEGKSPGTIDVAVSQYQSPFFEQPLMIVGYSSTHGRGSGTVVLEWGQNLEFIGRGGDGGDGGKGGDGGDGGGGGDGGNGGAGGNGASGRDGKSGKSGSSGIDATRDRSATNGSRGGNGTRGGNGVNGANGGDGGNAGNGGNGSDGRNAGNGGTGGAGANFHVNITGTEDFIQMVKASLSFDVRGGRADSAGEPGRGGEAGPGGSAGEGGDPGVGGGAGRGGSGGRGGRGGKGCWWNAPYDPDNPNQPARTITRPPGEPGPDGSRGSDGKSGRNGNSGKRGLDGGRAVNLTGRVRSGSVRVGASSGVYGASGRAGVAGKRGSDGVEGKDGTVQYFENTKRNMP